jgi:ABC-type bacteriocin/lantibiotic exporter with double-glycine peptidase domain
MKLSVPHYRQSLPYTCLPACVRMVLAYRGREHTEQALAQAFGTVPFLGTLPENVISGIEQLGFHALWFENASLERLLNLLALDWPVIIFLRAADLPHELAGLHAVVVVGIADEQVACLDPNLDHELVLPLTTFLQIWTNLGQQGLVVWTW